MILFLMFALQVFAEGPVCVVAERADLRTVPKDSAPVKITMGKYTPFLRLAEKAGWSRVQYFDGEIFWVQSKNLRAFSDKFTCAVVQARTAQLYPQPSSRAPASAFPVVDRYTPFKKLERNEAWIKVQDGAGHTSWIHESKLWIPARNTRIRLKN